MAPTKAQQAEAKLKAQCDRHNRWKMEKVAKCNRENNNNNDDDSLDVSAVSAPESPKAVQGHNAFNRSSHWNTPKKRRVRKKHIDVYVTTMNSPASTIDFPIHSRVGNKR